MNSPTEHKHTTISFIEALNKIKNGLKNTSHSPIDNESYRKRLKKAVTDIAEVIAKDPNRIEQIKNEINNPNSVTPTTKEINNLVTYYSKVNSSLDALINEDEQIKRLEKQAHTRNIIARGLTTLVIGFSIMGVYATAQWLGITMPMLRLATG